MEILAMGMACIVYGLYPSNVFDNTADQVVGCESWRPLSRKHRHILLQRLSLEFMLGQFPYLYLGN